MPVLVASRRRTRLSLDFPDALILDVTSRGAGPWIRLSPFYPHGGIPVRGHPDRTSQSVEGLWQALKVFATEPEDFTNREVTTMPPEAGPDWVEAEVIEVCRPDRPDHPLLRPHVVVLRERNGTRRLPMYTGSAEAIALACSLDAGEIPGPRIYQLAANLLAAAGSRITEVRITRLAGGVFHAVAVVEAPGGAVEVDARPSDAVNLAVLSGVPIRVDAAILDDPVVDSHPEWEQYPARLADLAAEERQRRADSQARLREHEGSPESEP